MMVAFVSTDNSMDKQDIADYIVSNLQDPLSRINGVGSMDVYGSQYAMRIWLDPNKLNSYQLTTQDVVKAIQSQNAQVAVGQLGGTPSVDKQALNATINAQSQLQTPEQFRQITLRVNQDGSLVTLGNVATVELGGENYNYLSRYNGMQAAGMNIKLASGANELQTDQLVKDKIAELSQYFPHGLEAKVAYETTPFVKASIKDVVKTLLEAILLVFLVMYLFLQNFRATLIPTIAVPVVLMGTFAILSACGFSINTLTMFAMVLAIGLLVDDAIVVVENVERVMTEEGLPPREATRKSMGQIQSALVGIALVLSAVFVPMAFFGGTTGAIYRQFSITIVSAMVLSVLVAMILTPALCATLLKPIAKGHHHGKRGFFGWFNRMFNRNAERYERGVGRILHASGRYMVIYLLLLGGMALLFIKLPTSFLPQEDRGIFTVQVQLPAGSTLQQTSKVVEKVEQYFLTEEKQDVVSVFAIIGSGPGGNGQNVARLFVRLKDWDLRTSGANSSFDIIDRATLAFNKINEARVIASSPPAITGLGNSSGFDMELEDHAGLGHAKLMAARDQLLQLAGQNPLLSRVRHNGLDDSPQLQIDIDQRKAQALGVSIDDINNTLSTAWGSTYVNDFVDRGRVKKSTYRPRRRSACCRMTLTNGMYATARAAWCRSRPSPARTGSTARRGWSAITAARRWRSSARRPTASAPAPPWRKWRSWSASCRPASAWNGPRCPIRNGCPARRRRRCTPSRCWWCSCAWRRCMRAGRSVLGDAGGAAGVIGAVAATWLRGLENDVYFQVGLLTIIGLSAKNAILIVEFANELNHKGQDLMSATLDASRMRLRPILMTSLAFIFGVLPMTTSSGAGSGSQHAVGTGVMGGMISATLLAIFFVPLFFVLVRRRFPGKAHPAGNTTAAGD